MEKILIVDDEKNYPMIIGEVLQEEGYSSLTAASSMEALERGKLLFENGNNTF